MYYLLFNIDNPGKDKNNEQLDTIIAGVFATLLIVIIILTIIVLTRRRVNGKFN